MRKKLLVVHADDFGLSPGISRGIIYSIKNGIVTSTSVVVKSDYLRDTRKHIQSNSQIDWGLHVYITDKGSITPARILNQTRDQLKIFINYFGLFPSHLDFHGGFKFNKETYFTVRMFALRNGLIFRYDNKHKVETGFYGLKELRNTIKDIGEGELLKIIESVNYGITELVCHPGWTSNRLKDPYRTQRGIEVLSLISKRVAKAIRNSNVKLIDFRDYKKYASER